MRSPSSWWYQKGGKRRRNKRDMRERDSQITATGTDGTKSPEPILCFLFHRRRKKAKNANGVWEYLCCCFSSFLSFLHHRLFPSFPLFLTPFMKAFPPPFSFLFLSLQWVWVIVGWWNCSKGGFLSFFPCTVCVCIGFRNSVTSKSSRWPKNLLLPPWIKGDGDDSELEDLFRLGFPWDPFSYQTTTSSSSSSIRVHLIFLDAQSTTHCVSKERQTKQI